MANPVTNLVIAAGNDFAIYEGDTTAAVLTFRTTATGDPVSMAGATVSMKIRKVSDNTLVETFSTTSGDIVISGASNNVLTIKGWERITLASSVGGLKYDLKVTQGSSVVHYLKGFITEIDSEDS